MQKMKISPEAAAPVMGISPNEIRYCMRNNKFDPPIGRVRIANNRIKKKKPTYRYDIFIPMVLEYTGLKEWPEGS